MLKWFDRLCDKVYFILFDIMTIWQNIRKSRGKDID